ncbi:MAG: cysteine hydrolase [Oscillospiraceae bacterium]|nr:cysteine hydrolase [Oscillospiraceae bacterium]
MSKVLVVVDYQNDFVNGSLGFNQSENIAGNIYSLVARYIKNGDLVVFTKDTHGEDYLSTREGTFLPVKHCIKGTDGHRLFGELQVFEDEIHPNVIVLEKSDFGCDKLCSAIEDAFGGEPDEIDFCGVVTNICVISNVVLCQTHFKNAKLSLHADACAAMDHMQKYAVEVIRGLGVNIVE